MTTPPPDKGMPFKLHIDGVKRKGTSIGGIPRHLIWEKQLLEIKEIENERG